MAEGAAGARRKPTALSPFRFGMFGRVWLGTLSANFGQWVQSVGAAWLMTVIAPSPDMVALVQTASSLPTVAFALIGGVLADLLDRRHVFIVGQSAMLLAAAALAICGQLGILGPGSLLFLTFILGCGSALRLPAYQAVVNDLVPHDEIPAAIALNSAGFNIARSTGPALGGWIVAAAGAQAAFLFNALSNVLIIVVLFTWRRRRRMQRLPRERIFGAAVAGLRYAAQDRPCRRVLLRVGVFGMLAISSWALLPLVAKDELGGGPVTYGLLLGALGFGALFGAAAMARLQGAIGTEGTVALAMGGFGVVTALLAVLHELYSLLAVLTLGGAAWLLTMSSFNVVIQMSAPAWVKGRALAVYYTAMFGGMALGSWLWGRLAAEIGVNEALLVSGVLIVATALLGHRLPVPESGSIDLRPSRLWPKPQIALDFDPTSGPVLVTIEYLVPREQAAAFAAAMQELRRIRRRDGARNWGLFEDIARPERWLETFTVGSWLEHLRQHDRATMADAAIEARARAFHVGAEPPVISTLIVHRASRPSGGSTGDEVLG